MTRLKMCFTDLLTSPSLLETCLYALGSSINRTAIDGKLVLLLFSVTRDSRSQYWHCWRWSIYSCLLVFRWPSIIIAMTNFSNARAKWEFSLFWWSQWEQICACVILDNQSYSKILDRNARISRNRRSSRWDVDEHQQTSNHIPAKIWVVSSTPLRASKWLTELLYSFSSLSLSGCPDAVEYIMVSELFFRADR